MMYLHITLIWNICDSKYSGNSVPNLGISSATSDVPSDTDGDQENPETMRMSFRLQQKKKDVL